MGEMVYLLRRRGLGKTSCDGIVAASQMNIGVHRSDRRLPEAVTVIRWGCTANVPAEHIINSAKAIHRVSDKSGFRALLDEHELCPATWFTRDEVVFPAIVRPQYHSQGKKLWLVNNLAELDDAINRAGEGWYASAYIKKTAEYRIYAAQGRAIAVATKIPRDPNAVAWNQAQGSTFHNVRWNEWPLKAIRVGLEGFKLSGLDFGGVDVMVDAENNAYILEINAAPSLTSRYRQGQFAKTFDYMLQNGKEALALIEEKGGYKKFIHPAVCEEALMRR
jgi:glutathione synthase/RimK-type ligase-like ATP-grasp enzyme